MAFSGAQITRLGPSATPRQKNGSFAGKTPESVTGRVMSSLAAAGGLVAKGGIAGRGGGLAG